MTLQRWKITIEYDGGDYSGWQRQIEGVPSVQESIETAIYQFCNQHVRIHCAGRTDAGVHAAGQVAHFDIDHEKRVPSEFEIAKAINALLQPQKISILKAEKVHPDFHARHHATSKIYRYRVFSRRAPPVFERNYVWHIYGDIDVESMNKAAQYLIGYHDFSSFRAQNCQAKNAMRSIDRADVIRCGDIIDFTFQGRSFLYHQVRNMVGSLMMVGQKKWDISKINDVLMAKDRTIAGPTAPPKGLSLMQIFYENQ